MGHTPELEWTRPEWFQAASAWIHAQLDRKGMAVSGPIDQPHVRPWSTVLRAPVGDGYVYFKASAPTLSHEPALTQALSRWRPDCMPPVLAADPERGWMLMHDLGASLRSLIRSQRGIEHWHKVLPLYAGVQIEMSGRLQELLALGALDRRLAALPVLYEELLADTEILRVDLPDGLTSEEYRRLWRFAPRFRVMCEQLAEYCVPETLHHDDLHDGNIFVRDGRYTFSDWAESCAAHPFFTLVVTLRSIAYTLRLEDSAPELGELRDTYLAAWTCYESRENLRLAFELANTIGMVNRALTWRHVVSSLAGPYRQEHAEAVPGWLGEFLDAVPGGSPT